MEKTDIKTEVKAAVKADVKPTATTNAPQGNRAANPNDRGGPRRDNRGPRRPRRDNEPKEFEERTVAIKRVTKVVKGGKHMRLLHLSSSVMAKENMVLLMVKPGKSQMRLKKH